VLGRTGTRTVEANPNDGENYGQKIWSYLYNGRSA
jgi:hypothetical protein